MIIKKLFLVITICALIFGNCGCNRSSNDNTSSEITENKEYTVTSEGSGGAKYLTGKINEIMVNEYISSTESDTPRVIRDYETIKKIIDILQSVSWLDDNVDSTFYDSYNSVRPPKQFSIRFIGDNSVNYEFFGITNDYDTKSGSNGMGWVTISKDNQTYKYHISIPDYKKIKLLDNKPFYLHKSDKKTPSEESAKEKQNKLFANLSEQTKVDFKEFIRSFHMSIEYTLLDGIEKNLRNSKDRQWLLLTDETTRIESDKYNYFSIIEESNQLKTFISKFEYQKAIDDLNLLYNTLLEAGEEHNIAKLFEAHQIIHDYDYWIANYPADYGFAHAPADWEGLKVYFGY